MNRNNVDDKYCHEVQFSDHTKLDIGTATICLSLYQFCCCLSQNYCSCPFYLALTEHVYISS